MAALLVAAMAMSAAVLSAGPRSGLAGLSISGLSIDSLFWLRHHVFGARHDPANSPVALAVIDEATYHTAPFADTPVVLWTPFLAKVIAGIVEAKPAALGLDLILPTSVEPFLPGYDRDFLRAIHAGAATGRLVLGKVQGQGPPILPFTGQVLAAGGDRNVRSTNVPEDADGIVRRFALSYGLPGGGREPTFALELAARARGLSADDPATRVSLGLAPPGRRDEALLNFDGGQPFPTYSLADLYACATSGHADFFRRQFAGKVVLIATSLDVEDRKLTSRRSINGAEDVTGQRCAGAAAPPAAAVPGSEASAAIRAGGAGATPGPVTSARRATLPGVFIHATAIQDILQHDPAFLLPSAGRIAVTFGAALLAASMALLARLPVAAAGLVAVAALVVAASTVAFRSGAALPLIESLVAAVGSFALMLAYRFAVADRDKRRIRAIFGFYLAPSLIDGMVRANRMPRLGGERRLVTFFFSDIAGFTSLSETSDPAVLAPVLNAYFDGVCDIVMEEGGLVVEFLGDGILAMFGAPTDQADHAARGVICARRVDAFAEDFRASGLPDGIALGPTRIGVHTGPAIVGNFGSTRRLKYAAMGDAVNTTSRIEGLNKYFGTRVCISGDVREAAQDTDVRPIGRVQVKGRSGIVEVFEVLPEGIVETPHMQAYLVAFAALSAGDEAAEARFAELGRSGVGDPAVAFHLARLSAGERSPIIVMTDK